MKLNRCKIFALPVVFLTATSWAETISLPLWDDAWIRGGQPDTNYGDSNTMRINVSGGQLSLIRFDAAAISGQSIGRAILRLNATSITNDGHITVYALTSSWSETNVTWATQPLREGFRTASVGISSSDSEVSVDVTEVVQRWADGSLPNAGLMIRTMDITRAFFVTKEGAQSAGFAAEIEVQTGGQPASMVDRITVLDGFRYVGDPPSHSPSWEKEVNIDPGVLANAKSAHIGLYTIHNELGRLVINGETIQLPFVGLNNDYFRWRRELGQTLISIPLGYLRPGSNTIRIESGVGNWTSENIYDDFQFGDIDIILSRR